MSQRRTLASALAILGGLVLAAARLLQPSAAPSRPAEPTTRSEPRAQAEGRTPAETQRARLRSVGDPERDAQIRAVVESMDRRGRPPEGVAQGGRRGAVRGLFENAEGRLPPRERGYYVESDVWPRGPSGRGAERLVFGREREVYYTSDHYRSFARVR